MPRRPPKEVTAERERRAWALRMQGRTQQQIADELGVDQSAVCYALQRIEKRLAEEFVGRVDELKARQTARQDFIISEAMAAWDRSKLDAESEEVTEEETEIESSGGFGGPSTIPATARKTKRVRKGQTGNPAYLTAALAAMADQRAIWGAEAPKKQDMTTAGQPLNLLSSAVILPAATNGLGHDDRDGQPPDGPHDA